MEDMTNRQIVLLTMLVSFVVSTATGIVTVAMLEEAPPILTQTVNRVVERTIERVITGSSTVEKSAPAPVTTITKEVTIYAKEDDLVVSAVERNQSRIARIFGSGTPTTSPHDAIGFVVSKDGLIATDAKSLAPIGTGKGLYVVSIGDQEYLGSRVDSAELGAYSLALIRLTLDSNTVLNAVSFGPKSALPKVAQTIVVLGGENGQDIFKATISKLNYEKSTGTSTPSYMGSIDTSPKIPTGSEGSLVVNLDGQAVGLVVKGLDDTRLTIFPAWRIFELVSAPTADKKQSTTGVDSSTVAAMGAL